MNVPFLLVTATFVQLVRFYLADEVEPVRFGYRVSVEAQPLFLQLIACENHTVVSLEIHQRQYKISIMSLERPLQKTRAYRIQTSW